MKKLLFLILAVAMVSFTACSKDDDEAEREKQEQGYWLDSDADAYIGVGTHEATITKLYEIVIRQNLIVPAKAYFMELNGKKYFYMFRSKIQMDLRVGDRIYFTVDEKSPNQIASINGYDVAEDGGEAAEGNASPGIGSYLVASNPIEAQIKGIISMKVKYLLPTPVDMWFFVTTGGRVIYMKKKDLNINLHVGDYIVYNVYTLFPNSIVGIKKLNR